MILWIVVIYLCVGLLLTQATFKNKLYLKQVRKQSDVLAIHHGFDKEKFFSVFKTVAFVFTILFWLPATIIAVLKR